MEKIQTRSLVCTTWKSRTAAAVIAVICAVALPQLFHLLGMASGLGSALGEAFLPMHLAIFAVGYFAGVGAGIAAGLLAPLVSFALTAAAGSPMPALPMLPYMTVELACYGLATGFFASSRLGTRLPTLVTLILAQLFGRAVRAAALAVGVLGFQFGPSISVIWTSLYTGLPGLLLQWVLLPLLVYWGNGRAKHA